MRPNAPERGFTLLELMVVIAILGLLGTIVAVNVIGQQKTAQLGIARTGVLQMQDVLIQFQLERRELPQSLDVLVKPDENGRVWITGFSTTPKDPWGNEYKILLSDEDPPFEVVSFGPDGIEGTEDDISSRTARDS